MSKAPLHHLIEVDQKTGCWLWKGETSDGYGRIYVGDDRVYAHRYFYQCHFGALPVKIQLDHMCRRRNCCRPEHMDPVTQKENLRRVHSRYRFGIVTCPEGHDLIADGILTPEGGRVCRICSGVDHASEAR